MRIIKCDLCDKEVDESVSIDVLDGEHPHCDSTMHRTIDCCFECIRKIKRLRCNIEFGVLKEAIKVAINSGK